MIIICNQASAWSIIQDQNAVKLVGVIFLFIISYLWYNAEDKIKKLGLTCLFIGGLSNLGERFFYGCVTDYWKWFDWWPSFNLADVIIVAGVVMITLSYTLKDHSKKSEI